MCVLTGDEDPGGGGHGVRVRARGVGADDVPLPAQRLEGAALRLQLASARLQAAAAGGLQRLGLHRGRRAHPRQRARACAKGVVLYLDIAHKTSS